MNAFIRYSTILVYKLYYNFHIEGMENVPEKEGVIIASNHRSYADPVLLTMPMKKPVTYMAKEELFRNKLFAAFIRMLGAFPVKRGSGDLSVIDQCADRLAEGKNVVIFPEGTRSKENKVHRGKNGVALIAARSGADVLPMGIIFEGPKLKFRTKLTLKVGKVITSEELALTEASEDIKRGKKIIMNAITELVEGSAVSNSADNGKPEQPVSDNAVSDTSAPDSSEKDTPSADTPSDD
ncbi:MAG: 1-acyl-sn-glycerol-3-phosphate acyltransferase [Oscillospiraceae bacterium]|nr:1-acyl-sn-glycerol-3-phosphate acyltransferase [Oscillospiraceae bacterium]